MKRNLRKNFEFLWNRTCQKYQEMYGHKLNIDTQEKIQLGNAILSRDHMVEIKEKFLNVPETPLIYIDISSTVIKKLHRFIDYETLPYSREDVMHEEIPFLGRKDETQKLESFLSSNKVQVLELYGIPLIGKSFLVDQFIESARKKGIFPSYIKNTKKIKANTKTINLITSGLFFEDELKQYLDQDKCLIIFENFESLLDWKCEDDNLHGLEPNYTSLKNDLLKLLETQITKSLFNQGFKLIFQKFLGQIKELIQ